MKNTPQTTEYLLGLTITLQNKGLITTCITCEFFDEKAIHCKMFNRQPPPRVVAQGCAEWSEGLPF